MQRHAPIFTVLISATLLASACSKGGQGGSSSGGQTGSGQGASASGGRRAAGRGATLPGARSAAGKVGARRAARSAAGRGERVGRPDRQRGRGRYRRRGGDGRPEPGRQRGFPVPWTRHRSGLQHGRRLAVQQVGRQRRSGNFVCRQRRRLESGQHAAYVQRRRLIPRADQPQRRRSRDVPGPGVVPEALQGARQVRRQQNDRRIRADSRERDLLHQRHAGRGRLYGRRVTVRPRHHGQGDGGRDNGQRAGGPRRQHRGRELLGLERDVPGVRRVDGPRLAACAGQDLSDLPAVPEPEDLRHLHLRHRLREHHEQHRAGRHRQPDRERRVRGEQRIRQRGHGHAGRQARSMRQRARR